MERTHDDFPGVSSHFYANPWSKGDRAFLMQKSCFLVRLTQWRRRGHVNQSATIIPLTPDQSPPTPLHSFRRA